MPKADLALVSCVAAAVLLASCSSTSGGAPGAREPAVVQISYTAVNPQTVRIPGDGNLSWVNMAADTRGIVVFPANIAPSFRCRDLKPYFTRAGSVYRSLPITGMQSERVQLPCPLAPGSYDYEVWLVGSGFGVEGGDDEPQQILRARIVVE